MASPSAMPCLSWRVLFVVIILYKRIWAPILGDTTDRTGRNQLAYFPILTQSSGVNIVMYMYFHFFTRRWLHVPSSRCKAAATVWFTSRSTFNASCVWLDVSILVDGRKNRRRLILSMYSCSLIINVASSMFCKSIHCVSLFLWIDCEPFKTSQFAINRYNKNLTYGI